VRLTVRSSSRSWGGFQAKWFAAPVGAVTAPRPGGSSGVRLLADLTILAKLAMRAPARPHDGSSTRRPRLRGPRRPGLRGGSAQPHLGRRHHLPQDLARLALPRRLTGPLQPPHRRLEHGRPHAHRARHRRARDGSRTAAARSRIELALRSRQPTRTQGVVTTPGYR
jgi:hypothetical protein